MAQKRNTLNKAFEFFHKHRAAIFCLENGSFKVSFPQGSPLKSVTEKTLLRAFSKLEIAAAELKAKPATPEIITEAPARVQTVELVSGVIHVDHGQPGDTVTLDLNNTPTPADEEIEL